MIIWEGALLSGHVPARCKAEGLCVATIRLFVKLLWTCVIFVAFYVLTSYFTIVTFTVVCQPQISPQVLCLAVGNMVMQSSVYFTQFVHLYTTLCTACQRSITRTSLLAASSRLSVLFFCLTRPIFS